MSAIFLLIVAGCDSNSDSSDQAVTPKPVPSSEFTVTGAVELFPAGAEVVVYPIANGAPNRVEPWASGVTDQSGHYQLTLPPTAVGKPAILEAVVTPGASLRCPILSGCGTTPFGAEMGLETELRVAAPVRALQPSRRYNLTALTSVLAKSLEADNAGTEADYLANFDAASLRIADRFELFGELAQLPLVDWTQVESLRGASIGTLRYSAIGPAAVSIWQAASASMPLPDAFEFTVERLAADGLPTTADDSEFSEVALNQEILAYAAHWSHSAPMAALISERRASNAVLDMTEEPYAVALGSNGVAPDELASVRKFVDDIRQAGTSINQKQLSSFRSLGDLLKADGDLLEKMGLDLEGINFLESTESDRLLAAVGKAFGAMMGVLAEHYTFEPVSNEINGIAVGYVDYGDHVAVTVNQSINACETIEPDCNVDVNLTLDLATESLETNPGIDYYRISQPDLKIFGRLSLNGLQLIIPEAKPISLIAERMVVFFGPDQSRPQEDTFQVNVDVSQARAALPLSLRFANTDERADTDYAVALVAGNAGFRFNSVTNVTAQAEVGRALEVVRSYRLFNTRDVYLDVAGKGESAAEGPQFGLSVAFENGTSDAELRAVQTINRQCTLANVGNCDEISNNFTTAVENAPPPLGMSATALGRAKLDGYPGPVWLKFSGSRVDQTNNAINFLTVSQPGNALWLNGEFNDDGATQLDAYNRQGYYFDIYRDGSMRDGGVYSPAGELVVELHDMGTWIKLTYPDGSFDSI